MKNENKWVENKIQRWKLLPKSNRTAILNSYKEFIITALDEDIKFPEYLDKIPKGFKDIPHNVIADFEFSILTELFDKYQKLSREKKDQLKNWILFSH